MKKFKWALLIVAVLVVNVMFVAADNDEVKVVFNGETVSFETAPIWRNHHLMVEMETIMDKLMSSVKWQKDTDIIQCMRDFDKLSLMVNSDVATVKNEIKRMEVPVSLLGEDTVMVPLQFVVEAYGGSYSWDEAGQTATITITDAAQAPMKFFEKMIMPYDDENTEFVDGIIVSDDGAQASAGAHKDKIIDGDYGTRWSASNKTEEANGQAVQHVIFDLGKETEVSGVGLSWFYGNGRDYSFAVEVSTDGQNYTPVIAKRTNMRMDSLESFGFDGGVTARAQYVKVLCYGDTTKNWSHITEMRVFVPDGSTDPDAIPFDLE